MVEGWGGYVYTLQRTQSVSLMRKPEFEVGWGCKGRKNMKKWISVLVLGGWLFFQWINLNLRFVRFFLLDRRSTLTCKRPTKNNPCTRIFTWLANTSTFHTLIFQQGVYISGPWFKGHSVISCSKISKTYEQHVFKKKGSEIILQSQSDLNLIRFCPPFFPPNPFFLPGMSSSTPPIFIHLRCSENKNLPAKCLCLGIFHLGLFCLHWSGSGFQGLRRRGWGCEVVKKKPSMRCCLEHAYPQTYPEQPRFRTSGYGCLENKGYVKIKNTSFLLFHFK